MGGGEQVPKAVPSRLWGLHPSSFMREDRGLLQLEANTHPFQNTDTPSHFHLVNDFSPQRAWVGNLCPLSSLRDLTWHKFWITPQVDTPPGEVRARH